MFWDLKEVDCERESLFFGKRSITYSQLDSQVNELSSKLLSIKQKVLIVLVSDNSLAAIVWYLSCLRTKHSVLLLSHTINTDLLKGIVDIYRPSIIVTPFNYNSSPLSLYCITDDVVLFSDLAVLLSTSGTTGSPKLVRLSYKNIQSNAESIREYLNIFSHDRSITNLPMSYSFGLSIINSYLLAGAGIVTTESSIVTKGFWELFNFHKCTSLSGVPFTYQTLKLLKFESMNLENLKTMTQAGGRLSTADISYFKQVCDTKNIKFYVMYGQTEATARMSYVPSDMLSSKLGSIGIAIPGGKFSLKIDNGESFDPGAEGEIVYRGANVMLGYATKKEDLSRGDELKGILVTGDLAKVDEDGYLYVTGRIKRFIKITGLRVNLDDVEKRLELLTKTLLVS